MWIYLLLRIETTSVAVRCPNYKYCDAQHYQEVIRIDTLRFCEKLFALIYKNDRGELWISRGDWRSIKLDSMWVTARSNKYGTKAEK